MNIYGKAYLGTDISKYITLGEAFATIVFIIFWLVATMKINHAVRVHEEQDISIEDYTVFVRHLPPNVTAGDLVKHFSNLYDLSADKKKYPLKLNRIGYGTRCFLWTFVITLVVVAPFIAYSGGGGAGQIADVNNNTSPASLDGTPNTGGGGGGAVNGNGGTGGSGVVILKFTYSTYTITY